MRKLIISSDELASIPELLPGVIGDPAPRPSPVSWRAWLLLSLLVPILPLLCLASLIICLLFRDCEPRVRHAWIHACFMLLIISGFLSTLGFGMAIGYLHRADPKPALPISLASSDGPFALDTREPFPNLPFPEAASLRDLAHAFKPSIFIAARDLGSSHPTREQLAVTGFGTGVLLYANEEEALIATCRHVIDGEHWQDSRPYKGGVLLFGREGGVGRAQIAGRHRSLDLMLLRVKRTAGKGRFVQPLLPFSLVDAGERVAAFGHPQGMFFSLSEGIVARTDDQSVIQVTAPVGPGASGGPLYDLHGQLLGIITSMMDKSRNPQAENVNFATRADALVDGDDWQMEPDSEALAAKYRKALQEAVAAPAPAPPQLTDKAAQADRASKADASASRAADAEAPASSAP